MKINARLPPARQKPAKQAEGRRPSLGRSLIDGDWAAELVQLRPMMQRSAVNQLIPGRELREEISQDEVETNH